MLTFGFGRHCEMCETRFSSGWRCRQCNLMACDDCTKGGKSSTGGKVLRGGLALYTAGLSEVVRAVHRSQNQACPKCGSKEFLRI